MQNEILLLIREHTGHNIDRSHVRRHLLPHRHHARHVIAKVQLAGLNVNIAGQDIVRMIFLTKVALSCFSSCRVLILLIATATSEQMLRASSSSPCTKTGVIYSAARHGRPSCGSIAAEAHDLACKAEFGDCFLRISPMRGRSVITTAPLASTIPMVRSTVSFMQYDRLEQSRSHFHHLSVSLPFPRMSAADTRSGVLPVTPYDHSSQEQR